MNGLAARHAREQDSSDPEAGPGALAALEAAALRIAALRPSEARCGQLLARLSLQIAEATAAAEDVAARQVPVGQVDEAGYRRGWDACAAAVAAEGRHLRVLPSPAT